MGHVQSQRGITLIELVVAMAVSAVVMTAVVAVVTSQQQAYYNGQQVRDAQGNARQALLYLEQKLPLAGFGMDAPLAFDFRYAGGPCPATMGACPPDAIANSDELVFLTRNPSYWVPSVPTADPTGHAWRITALDPVNNIVTVNARPGDVFFRGQILQAVCRGANLYAYMTVSQPVNVPIACAPPGNVCSTAISLQTDGTGTNPFRRQDQATDGCFTSGTARLFQIDRYRFHVRPIVIGTQGGATQYDPYLVLDMGIDRDGNGTVGPEDELIVAAGVELIQVSYVLTNGSTVGSASGTPITLIAGPGVTGVADEISTLVFPGAGAVPAGQNIYSLTSWYPYSLGPPPDPQRLTDHQANIREVRVAVVGRSAVPDRRIGGTEFILPYNMNQAPAWITSFGGGLRDGYQRVPLETSVALPNMVVRGMTYY